MIRTFNPVKTSCISVSVGIKKITVYVKCSLSSPIRDFRNIFNLIIIKPSKKRRISYTTNDSIGLVVYRADTYRVN